MVSCACEMYDTFRDAYFGQGLRYISGGRVCLYPEELSDFQLPQNYHVAPQDHSSSSIIPSTNSPDKDSSASFEHDAETPIEGHEDGGQLRAKHQGTDIEKNYTLEAPPSNHGTTIVTWYSETDQENPRLRPGVFLSIDVNERLSKPRSGAASAPAPRAATTTCCLPPGRGQAGARA